MNQSFPDSYTTRPAAQEDAALVCELWNARSLWTRNTAPHSEASVLKRWDDSRFNLATDCLLAFDPNSSLIGYAHIGDVANPPVDVFCGYNVHPEYDEQSWLWHTLFDWIDSEARRVIAKAPADARIALVAGASDEDSSEHQRLEEFGFAHSRTFYRMAVEFEKPITSSPMPAGIEIRVFKPGEDDEMLVHACRDAFHDHYGRLEQSFETDLAKWRRWMEEEDFDPALWFLATDTTVGGEVVGYCCCYPAETGDEGMGLIDELGVCRNWRRQGIGRRKPLSRISTRPIAAAFLLLSHPSTSNTASLPSSSLLKSRRSASEPT